MRSQASMAQGALRVVGAIVAGVFVGCGVPSAPVSETQHNIDEPTRTSEGWMWAATTDRQYFDVMGPLLGQDQEEFLSSEHVLTRRAQTWLDLIDANIRAKHGAELANVPRPKAKVKKDDSVNAFVAPIPVCYKIAVQLTDAAATASTTVNAVYLDHGTGELSEWPALFDCIQGTAPLATLQALTQRFNSLSSTCKLTVSGQGDSAKLTHNGRCSVNADLGDARAAKSVVFFQTSNQVTIHTKLFQAMTEPAFVAVLTHELGHYYRSHTMTHESEYDYFYTMGRENSASRPLPEPALAALGKQAIESSTMLLTSEAYIGAPQQTLRPELFMGLGSLIEKVCAAGSCPTECKTVNTLMKSASFKVGIDMFPFSDESEAQNAAYASFEPKALACVDKLDLSSTADTLTATAVSWDRFIDLVVSPTWPAWLGQLGSSGQSFLANLSELAALRAGDAVQTDNFGVALRAAHDAIVASDKASVAVLKEANARKLGFYTAEQEADDAGTEWMADIGIAPKEMFEAMRLLGEGEATSLEGMQLGSEDCRTLWQNNWMGADGTYQFVPIGDFTDDHHSICFRMFNIEREVKAHSHTPASQTNLPQLGGSAWDNLQSAAMDETNAAPTGPDPLALDSLDASAQALLKNVQALSCTYAPSRFKQDAH